MGFPDLPNTISDAAPSIPNSITPPRPPKREKKVLSFADFYRRRVAPEEDRRLDQLCALEDVTKSYDMFKTVVDTASDKGFVEEFMKKILTELTIEGEEIPKKEETKEVVREKRIAIRKSYPALSPEPAPPPARPSTCRLSVETVTPPPARKSDRIRKPIRRISPYQDESPVSETYTADTVSPRPRDRPLRKAAELVTPTPVRKSERIKVGYISEKEEQSPAVHSFTNDNLRDFFRNLIRNTPRNIIDFDMGHLKSSELPPVSREIEMLYEEEKLQRLLKKGLLIEVKPDVRPHQHTASTPVVRAPELATVHLQPEHCATVNKPPSMRVVTVTQSNQEPEREERPPPLPPRDYLCPSPTLIPLGGLPKVSEEPVKPIASISPSKSSLKRLLDEEARLRSFLQDHDYALPASKRRPDPEVISLSSDEEKV